MRRYGVTSEVLTDKGLDSELQGEKFKIPLSYTASLKVRILNILPYNCMINKIKYKMAQNTTDHIFIKVTLMLR